MLGGAIGDNGDMLIANALEGNRTIRSVTISRNNIGDEGVIAITNSSPNILLYTQGPSLSLVLKEIFEKTKNEKNGLVLRNKQNGKN